MPNNTRAGVSGKHARQPGTNPWPRPCREPINTKNTGTGLPQKGNRAPRENAGSATKTFFDFFGFFVGVTLFEPEQRY
jgi:hypothetical protein